MPLYEYHCDACGRRFEIIQKFSDPPPDACRHCGKGPVHRLLSSPAIQFKGTGWYVTDYAQKGKSDPSPAKGEDAKGESGKGEGAKSEDAKSEGSKSDRATAAPEASSAPKTDSSAPAATPASGTTSTTSKD